MTTIAKNKNSNGTALVARSLGIAEAPTADYPPLCGGDEVREMVEAVRANLGGSLSLNDLVRVKTPAGGSTKWVVPTISGEESVDRIVGLLVYQSKGGVLWPTDEMAGGNHLPVLVSHDLITAVRVGSDLGDIDPAQLAACEIRPGVYSWQALPWAQWGTGKGGVGKRVKEYRTLCVLQPGEVMPIVVRAGAGSAKSVDGFLRRMALSGVIYHRLIVGLRLVKAKSHAGIDYAQIEIDPLGIVPSGDAMRVADLYAQMLSAAVAADLTDTASQDDEHTITVA